MAMGQSADSSEMPSWVNGYFKDMKNSYLEVVSASGYDVPEAKNKAIKDIMTRRGIATGAESNVSITDGDVNVSSNRDIIVKARIIDEYVRLTSSGYTVYLLVQTAKHPNNPYEPVQVTDKYPFSARALVPGMAQIYKGSIGKGSVMIGAEVLAVGGIVAFEGMRSSYVSKISMTHDADAIKAYTHNASVMRNARNGCIAGAAAVYLWSLIDGVVAKGESHIHVGNVALNLGPYSTGQSSGFMLAMKF